MNSTGYFRKREFIKEIPKSDLHVHLDGSIRIPTLIELAKEQNIELPSYTEEGLRELVFKDRYNNLGEYLHGFKYMVPVLQDPESLERVAYELAYDNIREGVYYLEVRFAPQLHINPVMDIAMILKAVCRGMDKAANEFNSSEPVQTGSLPKFYYGVIACAMRSFTGAFSKYYKQFTEVLKFSPFRDQTSLASLELARAVVNVRDTAGIPVVGFDLAGQEDGHPAHYHVSAYSYVHQNFLKKTVHAGEAYGPESIFEAITDLHADRLGHAYHLFSTDLVESPTEEGKLRYIQALTHYIAARRITIEVCLTSNLQTLPVLSDLREHSFAKMLKNQLSVTLCTDNRTVSNTTVCDEIGHALDNFSITAKQLKDIVIYGYKRSFFHGGYNEKRKYVRTIINYYESIEKKYLNNSSGKDK